MPQELAQEQLSPHPIATPFLQIPDISQQIRSSPQDAKRGRGGLHGSIDSRSGDGHKSTTQDTRPAKRLTSARILGLANDQHPSRIARGHNSTPAKNSTDTALDSLPTSKSSLKSMVSTHRSTPGYLLPTRASSLRSKPSNYCARSVSDSGPELAKTRTTRTYSDSLKSSNPWNTLISKSHSTSSTQSVSSFAPEDSVSETHPTSNTQNLPMLPLDRAPGIAQRYGLADQHPIYRPGQASGFVQQGNGVVQYPSEPPVERYINHEGKIGVVVSRTHGSPWSHNLIEVSMISVPSQRECMN